MTEIKLTELDKKIIEEIQGQIPLETEPYHKLAEILDLDCELVISRLKRLKEKGILKRISALLNHRDSGYNANGMFVCKLEEDRLKQVANELSAQERVSHCYQRKSYPHWPYNFYAMVHGKTQKQVRDFLADYVSQFDLTEYKILFSTEEIKKTSMKYNLL